MRPAGAAAVVLIRPCPISPPALHSRLASRVKHGAASGGAGGWRLIAPRARRGGGRDVAVGLAAGAAAQVLRGRQPAAIPTDASSANLGYGKPPPGRVEASQRAVVEVKHD